jgi:hypothetical protein
MKIRTSLWLAALLVAGLVKADEDIQRICEYTKVDDRSSLRRKLDDAEIDLRRSYDDIRCGGEMLLRYAALNGSVETATFIISKVGKRSISEVGKDGMNAIQWTEKKLYGADDATKTKMIAVIDLMKSKL